MRENIWIFGVLLLIVSFFFDSEILGFFSVNNGFLTTTMTLLSEYIVILLVLVLYFILLRDRRKIFLLWLGFVLAFLLSLLIKILVMRERPADAIIQEVGFSFPSTHAIVVFSMVAMMNREFPKLKWLFLGIALVISFSRLYLGVHYASDLVFGGFLGYGIGLGILNRKVIWTRMKSFVKI